MHVMRMIVAAQSHCTDVGQSVFALPFNTERLERKIQLTVLYLCNPNLDMPPSEE